MLANLPKTTFISKYRPTPMFSKAKFLLTDENISSVEKMIAKLSLSLSVLYATKNMTKLLKKAVACAMALSKALPKASLLS